MKNLNVDLEYSDIKNNQSKQFSRSKIEIKGNPKVSEDAKK